MPRLHFASMSCTLECAHAFPHGVRGGAPFARRSASVPGMSRGPSFVNSKCWKTHCDLGKLLYINRDVAGAEAEFCTALTIDPKNTATYFHLGLFLKAKGDMARAEAELRAAVALDLKNTIFYIILGYILEARSDMLGPLHLLVHKYMDLRATFHFWN